MAYRPLRRGLVLLAGCLAAFVGPHVQASRAQGTPPVERPMPHMQAMNRVLRSLKAQGNDSSQNRSSVSLVSDLEWSTFSAKEALPLRATILPDAERHAMLDDYRREFLKLLRLELDLEEAFLNGDNVAATRLLAAIEATEDEGHERFR